MQFLINRKKQIYKTRKKNHTNKIIHDFQISGQDCS